MKYESLKNWADKKKYFFANKAVIDDKSKIISHTCLDGGVFCIPDDQLLEFEYRYSKCLSSKSKMSISERINPECFVFFIDIDYKDNKKTFGENVVVIESRIPQIYSIICKVFECEFKMIVCSRKEDFIGDKAKTGYHLIFPDLYVNLKIARDTVTHIVNKLNEISPSYTWNKIIDTSVYLSGLRMIGSTKGKQSEMVYMPRNTYGYSENYLDDNVEKYIFDCSVRALGEFNLNFPRFDEYDKINVESQNFFKLPSVQQKNFVELSPERRTLILNEVDKFIKTLPSPINKEWSDFNGVSDVLVHIDGNTYLFKTLSKYCTNKGRCHNNNHVYFSITKSGLKQKCYSNNKYRFGSCSNYTSTIYPLSARAFKVMFPGKKQTKAQTAPYDDNNKLFKSVSLIKKDRKSYLQSSLLTIQHLEQGLK